MTDKKKYKKTIYGIQYLVMLYNYKIIIKINQK